jgi:hypothetical protein
MSNYLDELFAAGVPELRYAWTWTDADPSDGSPSVAFATGMLVMTDAPLSRYYYRGPRRYVDSTVKDWQAQGLDLAPSSFPKVPRASWVNQLMIIRNGANYMVQYGNRTNFNVESGSYIPEVYDGGGFPGFTNDKTAVLVARIWLGVSTIVLSQPGAFFSGFTGHPQENAHAFPAKSSGQAVREKSRSLSRPQLAAAAKP